MVDCKTDISLADTEMEVLNNENGGYWSKFRAVVTMRLTPVPRVFIEASFDIPSDLLNYGQTVRVRLPAGPEIKAQVVRCHIGADFQSRLVPDRQPVTIMQARENVQCVNFQVINYPSLHRETHPALLKYDKWLVELHPLPELREVKTFLASESGYALTHRGSIRRSNGDSFPVEEAETILGALHLLLSFSRGGNCGLTLISGKGDDDDIVWQQWGSYSTFPWFSLTSWIDHRHNGENALSGSWPGILQAFQKNKMNSEDRFRIALYWYLRSNEADSPYVGIVLTQAALERLAREILKKTRRGERDQRGTKGTIRAALQHIGVNPDIPKCCHELHKLHGDEVDGPSTLIKMRNNLIHPQILEDVSLNAYVEAQDLGQWYVELFLLWLIGYKGEYANRLAYRYDGKWTMLPVPWSRDDG